MRSPCYLVFLILFGSSGLCSQQFFTRVDHLISDQETHSGVAVAIADMNGDFTDDIIYTDQSRNLVIAFQNVNGRPYEMKEIFRAASAIWSIAVGDANNDGQLDILVCHSTNCDVLINQGTDFISEPLSVDHFPQGANMVDVNTDGKLDFFICNDNGPNKVLMADQGGYVLTALLDDTDGGSYDGSGNYGSTWVDFDRDGDLDLYIAKCRAGVGDPLDKRRVNRLYINDNGSFTEGAGIYGLDVGDQSWAADFGDIDNDGDLDLYMINHHSTNKLFINENGVYQDQSFRLGTFENGSGIQCLMADVNNDTYLDIIVTGTKSFIHLNNAGQDFTWIDRPLGAKAAESFSLGDLNGDGYVDIAAGYANLFTTPSTKKDLVWLNNGGINNYFVINLLGIQSNINGVGSMIELYGEWGVQLREVRSGESYGVSRSLTQYFGLGQHEHIDSVRIWWPSGQMDNWTSPTINTHYLSRENMCLAPIIELSLNGEDQSICPDQNFEIWVDEGAVLWNTGENGPTLTVDSIGTYFAHLGADMDCDLGVVKARKFTEFDGRLDIERTPPSSACPGQSITLRAPDGTGHIWDNTLTDPVREVSHSGLYTVEFVDPCGDTQMAEIDIQLAEVGLPITYNDTINEAGISSPWAQGDSLIWYADQEGSVELYRGDTLRVEVQDDTTFYVANGLSYKYNETRIAPFGVDGLEPVSHLNPKIFFDVFDDLFIEAISVEAATPGRRRIQIFDRNEDVFFEADFDLTVGLNTLTLNVMMPMGLNYYITTDGEMNMVEQGDVGPRLLYYDMDNHFPIEDGSRLEITGTSHGADYYYHFIDWSIYSKDFCTSEILPVDVEVERPTKVEEQIPLHQVRIYPNPISDQLYLEIDADLRLAEITCIDVLGRVVSSQTVDDQADQETIDVHTWSSGLYSIMLTDDRGRKLALKVVK